MWPSTCTRITFLWSNYYVVILYIYFSHQQLPSLGLTYSNSALKVRLMADLYYIVIFCCSLYLVQLNGDTSDKLKEVMILI